MQPIMVTGLIDGIRSAYATVREQVSYVRNEHPYAFQLHQDANLILGIGLGVVGIFAISYAVQQLFGAVFVTGVPTLGLGIGCIGLCRHLVNKGRRDVAHEQTADSSGNSID